MVKKEEWCNPRASAAPLLFLPFLNAITMAWLPPPRCRAARSGSVNLVVTAILFWIGTAPPPPGTATTLYTAGRVRVWKTRRGWGFSERGGVCVTGFRGLLATSLAQGIDRTKLVAVVYV